MDINCSDRKIFAYVTNFTPHNYTEIMALEYFKNITNDLDKKNKIWLMVNKNGRFAVVRERNLKELVDLTAIKSDPGQKEYCAKIIKEDDEIIKLIKV